MRLDPNCKRCGKVETMEHLLYECEYYSELLWNRLANILTQLFNRNTTGPVPRVMLGQINIIYNIPIPPSSFTSLTKSNATFYYC